MTQVAHPGVLGPVDYLDLPALPEDWNVLEIGPGRFPLLRADLFIDADPEMLLPLQQQGRSVLVDNLERGLQGIQTKEFDFCWISHVLEHIDDLAAAVRTLNRIAKRGMVVVPSALKESLFFFEETEHRWTVLPSPRPGGPLVFVRRNPDAIDGWRDPDMQRAASILFREGFDDWPIDSPLPTVVRRMSAWFRGNERQLDLVARWDEDHPLVITIIQ